MREPCDLHDIVILTNAHLAVAHNKIHKERLKSKASDASEMSNKEFHKWLKARVTIMDVRIEVIAEQYDNLEG